VALGAPSRHRWLVPPDRWKGKVEELRTEEAGKVDPPDGGGVRVGEVFGEMGCRVGRGFECGMRTRSGMGNRRGARRGRDGSVRALDF